MMSDKYPTHFTGYGLGINMQDYAGKQCSTGIPVVQEAW